jgi:hypothetical protein
MTRHAINKPPRCRHRTRSGRFCRLNTVPGSRFCPRHAPRSAEPVEPDLAAKLTSGLGKFNSPAAVNDFLSRLLLLLAQDRISPRRAAVLAYITNQILRSVYAMEAEAEKNREPTKIEYIIGIPRPGDDLSPQSDETPSP